MTNLIHIPVDGKAFGRWSAGRGFRDEQVALHALTIGVFGRDGVRQFRYHDGGRDFAIYGYSELTVEELRSRAEMTATPDVEDVIDLSRMRAKAMPEIPAGTRIGFDLRCCPTRRSKAGERDAWAVEAAREGGAESAEEAYLRWFAERVGKASEIESFRVVRKKTAETSRKGRKVKLPDVTVQGTVLVSDAAAFAELMRSGVGRHGSYGMGMLMLRPADPEMA